MEFITKKPPIVMNSQRTLKRSLNLHFAIIIIAIASIILKMFTKVPESVSYTAFDQTIKVILMLVIGAGVSVLVEYLYALSEGTQSKFYKHKGFIDPINTGLLIALLLPTVTPIYVLILAVIIGVYAGKIVFGGYGYYIFIPVLVGVLFANLSFKSQLIVEGTPLSLLKDAISGGTFRLDNLKELFIGNYEAIAIGSTSVLFLVMMFFYLAVTRVIDLRTTGTFLLSVLIMSFGIGIIWGFPLEYAIVNLMTGLTIFGVVFLISEPVSSPTSRETKMIYAVVVAILMMLVRVLGDQSEGLIFAILFGNLITPFINRTVKRSNKSTMIKTSIILFVIVIFTTITIGFILQGRLIEVLGGAL